MTLSIYNGYVEEVRIRKKKEAAIVQPITVKLVSKFPSFYETKFHGRVMMIPPLLQFDITQPASCCV